MIGVVTAPAWTLFTAPVEQIDATLLERCIQDEVAASSFKESRTLEVKSARHGENDRLDGEHDRGDV